MAVSWIINTGRPGNESNNRRLYLQRRRTGSVWYIERKSKEEIAAAVNYASATSVYDLRNKAVAEFALRYFGAGALPSV